MWNGPPQPPNRRGGCRSQAEPRAAFAALITALDAQVGELLQLLDSLQLTENTLRAGWKAVRYQVNTGEGDWERYNLAQDPGETSNLATAQPDTLRALVQLVKQAHQASPDFPLDVARATR